MWWRLAPGHQNAKPSRMVKLRTAQFRAQHISLVGWLNTVCCQFFNTEKIKHPFIVHIFINL